MKTKRKNLNCDEKARAFCFLAFVAAALFLTVLTAAVERLSNN